MKRQPTELLSIQPDPPAGQAPAVTALSADHAILRADNSLWHGARLHSIFQHVLNIQLASGGLLTLACRDSDNAPNTIVVNVAEWSGMRLQSGSPVRFAYGCIVLGDELSIELGKARPWSCYLPVYASSDLLLRANLAIAEDYLEEFGCGIGVRCTEGRTMSPFERDLTRVFREQCEGLFQSILLKDVGLARRHIDRLIGLGPGLTPAGDDYLVGLLTALNIPDSPGSAWRSLGAYVIVKAAQSTNAISLAALQQAANGQVRYRLVRLCVALLYEDSASLKSALDHVLAIGASSGTDIALGLLSGFRLHIRS